MLHEAITAVPVLARLEGWRQAGWLRQLDLAFAAFLHAEGGERDETVLLLAALASQQLGRGHICLDLEQILAEPERLLPPEALVAARADDAPESPNALLAGLTPSAAAEHLTDAAVVDLGAGSAPLVIEGNRLYLRRYWQYERTVAEGLGRLLDNPPAVPVDIADWLDRFFPAADATGVIDWQRIACALAARGRLTLLTGGPGTGKTTTVTRMLGLLQSLAMAADGPLRIRLAAPTGKAAARLTESIGEHITGLPVTEAVRARIPAEVTTLHRLLGRRPGSRGFRHDRHNPLHADLVVVDEASMVDLEMMASLIDALGSDTRLILIGDKDQLASVEAGAVMGDLCAGAEAGGYGQATVDWLRTVAAVDLNAYAGDGGALADRTVMLRRNHRFGETSGIGRLARAVNAGDVEAVRAVRRGAFDDLAIEPLARSEDRQLEALCVEHYRHYLAAIGERTPTAEAERAAAEALEQFGHFQLLAVLRAGPTGVEGLNRRIASALHEQGLIARTEGWYPGRPVMLTRNDYGLGLMNGDIGITLALADDTGTSRTRVAFRIAGGHVRLVLPIRLTDVETVYAMTVHKAQGSEFRYAALVLPDAGNPLLTRELIYTAITRARDHFTLLGADLRVLESATRKRLWRASGLASDFSQPTV